MNKKSKLLCIFMSVLMFTLVLIVPNIALAKSSDKVPKILLILNDINAFNEIEVSEYSWKYDLIDIENFNSVSDIYSAYAVDIDSIENNEHLANELQKAYKNHESKVYLYGELTIADYKNALNLDVFGKYVDIIEDNGESIGEVFQEFADNTQVENIISHSTAKDTHLIATVIPEHGINTEEDYLKIILDDYEIPNIISFSAKRVHSDYDIRTYLGTSNFINMDYFLYQDTKETDPKWDYFALRTNITAENNSLYRTSRLYAKHSLGSANEMIDYGPSDTADASSVSVGLDLGSGDASVSYTFDVSGSPKINATYSPSNDYVEWDIIRKSFNSGLQNNLFSLGSSWDNAASLGGVAVVRVEFSGQFQGTYNDIITPVPKKITTITYYY